ncbi:RidA family protein [Candidatus Fermentibacterales bacterium]|nr:RidA family protein [Candidatus Fermentibacterales bacterium]
MHEVRSEIAPPPVGPYSQAIRSGSLVFVSGQLGLDPETGKLAPDVRSQARAALENIGRVLEAAGLGYGSVVKVTVLLRDMSDFSAVNEVYATFFDHPCPARAAFAVVGLPLNALVEIEAVAETGSEAIDGRPD